MHYLFVRGTNPAQVLVPSTAIVPTGIELVLVNLQGLLLRKNVREDTLKLK